MTDRVKIVRIRARNVHRVHGHKRLDDDAFLASLSLSLSLSLSRSRKATASRAEAPRRRPVETFKKSFPDNMRMSGL